MEGAADGRQGRHVITLRVQIGQSTVGFTDDLTGLFDEDAAHFIVFFQAGFSLGARRLRHQRRKGRWRRLRLGQQVQLHGLRHRLHEVAQGRAHVVTGLLLGCIVLKITGLGGTAQRLLRRGHTGGQFRLFLHQWTVGQRLQLVAQAEHRHVVAGQAIDQGLSHVLRTLALQLFGGPRHHLDRVHIGFNRLSGTAHDGREHTGVGIESKQRLHQVGLHAQHVDQKAHRTEVGGQAVMHTGFGRGGQVCIGGLQGVDVLTHAAHCLRGRIQPQHAHHALHGLKVRGHRHQGPCLRGVTEELVDALLALAQRMAQLLHHAAHGLAVRHLAVERFHPGFERLGRMAFADQAHALGQALHALALFGVFELAFIERGFEVQQAGGHFHGQGGHGGLGRLHGRAHGVLQGLGQRFAIGVEPAHRIGHQRELLVQTAQAQQLTRRDGRPAVLGLRDALDGLRDPAGIKAAQRGLAQVNRGMGGQLESLTQLVQHTALGALARRRRLSLGAEEQEFMREAIGQQRLATGQGAQLTEQAREHALDVHRDGQTLFSDGLQEATSQHPGGRLAMGLTCRGTRGQIGAQAHQRRGVCRQPTAQQLEQGRFKFIDRINRGLSGLAFAGRGQRHFQRHRRPLLHPQVRGAHHVATGQFGQGLIWGEQGHHRDGLARQATAHEVQQSERSRFDGLDALLVHRLRTVHIALYQGLTGAQQGGATAQAGQLQRTDTLVQLLTGIAQHGRVDRVHVGKARGDRFFQATLERLLSRLQ